MRREPDPFESAPMQSPDGDDSSEVVAVSPVVRKLITSALVVLVVVMALTLAASIIDSLRDSDEVVAEEVSLIIITTTTTLPPVTSSVEAAPTTEAETTTTTPQPEGPSPVFGEFPTKSQLVLWTYNERRVFIVDIDAGTNSELDLTEFGVPLVERIVGVGDRLVVQSLGDFHAIDIAGESVRLDAGGVVQAFGDDEVWVTDSFIGDAPTSPTRIDVAGERRTLPEIPADTFPFGFVDNRLLVGAGRSGGIYIEGDGKYEYLSDGELIGSGDGFILARKCDAILHCSLFRIEVATGVSTQHEVPPGFSLTALWWIEEPISPRVDAVLGLSEELGSPAIWDLLADEVTPLAIAQGRGAAWSPDGSWVFASVSNQLVGFHRGTGVEVAVPLPAGVDFASALQLAVLPVPSGG